MKITKPKAGENGGGGQTHPTPTTRTKKISTRAICKTPTTIKSQSDIDSYIASVKAKLEEQLTNNDEIIIL